MLRPLSKAETSFLQPGRYRLLFVIVFTCCFAILSIPSSSSATQITLAWNRNADLRVTGYRLYYGTASYSYTHIVDVGNTTTTIVSDLLLGETYFFAVTAYDNAGNESGFSSEVSYTVPGGAATASPRSDAGSGGSGCFVATAAYGSPFCPEVEALRHFRDACLLTNAPGRAFVKFYYEVSPKIADVIRERESLKAMTRFLLGPVVLAVNHPTGFAFTAIFLMVGLIVIGRKLVRPPARR